MQLLRKLDHIWLICPISMWGHIKKHTVEKSKNFGQKNSVTGIGLRGNYGWKIVEITTHVAPSSPTTEPAMHSHYSYKELHC